MMKHEVLQGIVDTGVVAVVRADTSEPASRIAEACAEGGVAAVEITFTIPGATDVILGLSRLLTRDRALIGAGTVLDPETARAAVLSDAQFVVSPGLNADGGSLCNRCRVPYLPGAGTVAVIHSQHREARSTAG